MAPLLIAKVDTKKHVGKPYGSTFILPVKTVQGLQKCTICGKAGVYKREYTHDCLCKECFCNSITEKTRKAIAKNKMVRYGETIAVAVSGGKDSLSLLQVMKDLSFKHGSKLYAITIDEGVPGYREESIRLASDFSSKLGVKHMVLSFKDLYDLGLEDALEQREGKVTSCAICGTFRRRALDLAAMKVGADVVATGHNLDDFVQTYMINLFSGDIQKIKYADPPASSNPNFPVRRIKPFQEIYEKEIAFFAYLNDIPFQVASCPHMNEGIRTEVRNFLNTLEMKHPGIKQMTQKSAFKISEQLNEGESSKKILRKCEKCGSPSSGKICSVCLMLEQFKSKSKVSVINRSSVR